VLLEDLGNNEQLHRNHKSFVTHYLFWRHYESSNCYMSCKHLWTGWLAF